MQPELGCWGVQLAQEPAGIIAESHREALGEV